MDIYEKLKELSVELPAVPPLGGLYKPVVIDGTYIYVSGQGCTVDGKPVFVGKLGSDVSLEHGREAAKICGINALANIHHFVGDLNKIKRVVKILGFVASTNDFFEQPKVIDGLSNFFKDLFGDTGVGVRSAIGVNVLPNNMPVEAEFLFQLKG